MCQQYWTLETCGEKFGPFIVETTAEIKSDPSITVRDFTITNTLNVSEEKTQFLSGRNKHKKINVFFLSCLIFDINVVYYGKVVAIICFINVMFRKYFC